MRIRDWSSDVCSSDLANVISLNTLHFGDSRVEKAVRQAERLLEKDIPLLIHGETGVGKEVFVKALHQASSRSKQPFIAVNCAAIPAELVESELFGYEKGEIGRASCRERVCQYV